MYGHGYCTAHLAELYRKFNPAAWTIHGGVGLPHGARPDHGDGYHDLRCVACDATWVGPTFQHCPWCIDALAAAAGKER
jgi:hypothetical protein